MWPFPPRTSEREAFLEAIQAMREVSVAQAAAATELAKSFSAYLEMFKTSEAPTTHVIREEDEYRMELQREIDSAQGAQKAQLMQILRSMDEEA